MFMSLTDTATRGHTIEYWNERLGTSSVHRWLSEGLVTPNGGRVRLKGVRVGGAYRISEQAVEEFLAAVNGVASPAATEPAAAAA